MRNILAKLPRAIQGRLKKLIHQVFLAPSHEDALKRGRALITRFKDRYPAAMECLEKDLEESVTHLRFPSGHHVRIRTTSRLERLNGEGRRRTRVIPRFPTERSLPELALCVVDHGLCEVARGHHDTGDPQEVGQAAHGDHDENGGDGCLTRGNRCLEAFTGKIPLDHGSLPIPEGASFT
jgi:hypothetical protein